MKFTAGTLGCKVNQYDTQMMREMLGLFWEEAAEGEKAGLVVVNTCAVTAEAERQSRQALRRARRNNPGAAVVAAGCLAKLAGPALVESGLADRIAESSDPDGFLASMNLEVPVSGAARGISGFSRRTRAFLKVQDGCDRRCTYCVVPMARGTSRSRPAAEAVAEAGRLAAGGVPELVICGVRLNAYRDPESGAGLAGLMSLLIESVPSARFRLSSIYPGKIEKELIELITGSPRVCRHVHVPVQSGSERMLKAMGRGYSAADVRRLAEELRRLSPGIGLTADVIVGFPGEEEDDFNETLGLVSDCGFHHTHIFPFSPRPGTPAFTMPLVKAPVVKERVQRLRSLDKKLLLESMNQMRARETSVVIEGRTRGGLVSGLTDTYHRVMITGRHPAGKVLRTRITGVSGFELLGEPAEARKDG